jgi:hypothetical protein
MTVLPIRSRRARGRTTRPATVARGEFPRKEAKAAFRISLVDLRFLSATHRERAIQRAVADETERAALTEAPAPGPTKAPISHGHSTSATDLESAPAMAALALDRLHRYALTLNHPRLRLSLASRHHP